MSSESRTSRASRGGNLIFLGISQLFRLGSGLMINVMVMRALGVEEFGVYGYVVALVGLATFGANLGMDRLIKRDIAQAPERADRLVSAGLAATALLSVATGAGIVAVAALVDGRPMILSAAALGAVALGLRSLATVPEAAAHAERRMGLSARGHVAGRIVLVVITAALLWLRFGVIAVFIAQVLDAVVTLVITWVMYRRHLSQAPLRTAWPEVRDLVRESTPFGLNLLFGSVYLTSDVLLLAWLRDDTEVGIYRGAVMLITLFPIIANTLTTGLFPRLARCVGQPEKAGEELRFAARVLLAISVPAAVGGVLLAEPLMVFIGGAPFSVSAAPFVVMAPLLPLRFLNNSYATTLSALNRQGDRTRGVFGAAILNLVANLIAIPAYGAVGAAATTLLTEIFLTLWLRWRVQPLITDLGLWSTLLRVGLPAAAMAAALLVSPSLHVLLTVLMGALVYGALGLVSGAWHPSDLRRLRSI